MYWCNSWIYIMMAFVAYILDNYYLLLIGLSTFTKRGFIQNFRFGVEGAWQFNAPYPPTTIDINFMYACFGLSLGDIGYNHGVLI